ncbi:MAG TPA: choice-of-anchor O protein, partial [Sulfuricurvum sp.]|nr:choice-of-anchor O protein [Sulfuricurvum sp.]
EGPGDGWSGATTNHGADLWYSMITMDDFVLNDGVGTRPTPLNTFSYPVRITDNEACKADGTETKLYCQPLCDQFGTGTALDSDGTVREFCQTGDVDMLTGEQMVLNGDTGASRPVIKLLRTNASTAEYVVVLGYEETKGMSENQTSETNIELEGKSVYFETFPFKKIVSPTNEDEFKTLLSSLPMVSSGNIINVKAPEVVVNDDNTTTATGDMIYENARRLTFIPQIDPCDSGKYTYGWLYKQGIFTQGGSSDMYVRFNNNFDATLTDPVNVSANADDNTTDHLTDNSYDDMNENSFSPRGFMRGDDIYIGFEYTPDYHPDSGYSPNNFYIRRYTNDAWQPAQNISLVAGNNLSTLDPRFVTTPSSKYNLTGGVIESDKSNPNVLFMAYGTFDIVTGIEQDLYYTRSTDKGVTWETVGTSGVTPNANLAIKQDIEEKEVQSLATPDGTRLFNAWLQESVEQPNVLDLNDHFLGLDTWFGVVNYNILK